MNIIIYVVVWIRFDEYEIIKTLNSLYIEYKYTGFTLVFRIFYYL